MYRIAMISAHSCPLASLGSKETGGMNVYIRELSSVLASLGMEIDIFTRSQNPSLPRVVTFCRGMRIIHLKAGPETRYDKNQLWHHLPEFIEGISHFIHEENLTYHLIHSHYWLSGWVGSLLRKQWGIPFLHMFHTLGYLKNKALAGLGKKESSIRLEVEPQITHHADHIVVASPREKVQLIWGYGAPSKKISVIPCGVNLHLFTPHHPLQSKVHLGLPQKRLILFVGRLDPVKAVDTLLKAMAIVKKRQRKGDEPLLLIIGGEGSHVSPQHDELPRLKRLSTKLKLNSSVTFLGPQQHNLLPYFYSAAEVSVFPSLYESFGMAALESMACGTPVIVSKVGGLASIIQDQQNGLLVPEGDPSTLAETILKVLTQPHLKQHMGLHARRTAEKFSWSTIAGQMIELYHSLRLSLGENMEWVHSLPIQEMPGIDGFPRQRAL